MLNFVKGQTVANFAIAGISISSTACVLSSVSIHHIVDLVAVVGSQGPPIEGLEPTADAVVDGSAPEARSERLNCVCTSPK